MPGRRRNHVMPAEARFDDFKCEWQSGFDASGKATSMQAAKPRDYVTNVTWLACIANHTVIPAKAGT